MFKNVKKLAIKKSLGVKSSFTKVCIHQETSLRLQLAVLGSKVNILCFVWQLMRHNLLTDSISFVVTNQHYRDLQRNCSSWQAHSLSLRISYRNPVATQNTGLKQKWLFASLLQQYLQCAMSSLKSWVTHLAVKPSPNLEIQETSIWFSQCA